jgi:ribosome-binding protein aMBF1 (putative translation factor)
VTNHNGDLRRPELEELAGVIRERQQQSGLSNPKLAEQTKVQERTVIRWRNAQTEPSPANALELARILGGLPNDYRTKREDFASLGDRLATLETVVKEIRASLQVLQTLVARELGQSERRDEDLLGDHQS